MSQTVIPYLLYEDAAGALDFLSRAFGFHETMRSENEGRVAHAEMSLGEGRIMLGQPAEGFRNPKHLGGNTMLMYVYVDDVDSHFEHARSAGAEIVDEPADQEYRDRHYHARDPEGHDWYFAQPVRVGAGA
jgi:PhnB protein